jgi:hypothetical protein
VAISPLVLQILQVGFVGLAFLLAYMAYRLLHAQADRKEPNQAILDATSRYMLFALGMALLAVAAQLAQSLLPVNVPSDIDGRLTRLTARVDNIRLVAREARPSPTYGCGGTQRAEPNSLQVMSGLTDGTSCGVLNVNYYKELSIDVPR